MCSLEKQESVRALKKQETVRLIYEFKYKDDFEFLCFSKVDGISNIMRYEDTVDMLREYFERQQIGSTAEFYIR